MQSITVLNLCGCPASGKTTLARTLQTKLLHFASVAVISFDDVERMNYEMSETEWDRTVWHSSRIQAYRSISMLLDALKRERKEMESVMALPPLKSVKFGPICTESQRIVIIVDDTMHLRSMRKTVMKICKTYECGYAILFVNTPKDELFKRNQSRFKQQQVPNSSIQTILDSLQVPDPSIRWERYSLEIRPCDQTVDKVKDLIVAAEQDPLSNIPDVPVADPESYTSFKHQLDLRLRKAVGKLAVTMKPKMKEIAWKRKQILQSMDDLAEEVCADDPERIIAEIVESFMRDCSHFNVS